MPTLTLQRPSASAPIRLSLMAFNKATGQGASVLGLFDTGNDHTVISRDLFEALGLEATGRRLPVQGVTGGSVADTAFVTLGILFDGDQKVTIDHHEVAVVSGASDAVLIGRDFLERFDVAIRRDGTFTLTC